MGAKTVGSSPLRDADELRHVMPLGQPDLDAFRISFGFIVGDQRRRETCGFDTHNPVRRRIKVIGPAEYIGGDRITLQPFPGPLRYSSDI